MIILTVLIVMIITSRQTAAPEGLTRSVAEGLNPRRCEGRDNSIIGLNVLPIIVDSPKGYVTRVNRPERFSHHPTNASNFWKGMTTILQIILNMKATMEEVKEVVDSAPNNLMFGSQRKTILPASFIPATSTKSSKKRKVENVDVEQESST